MQENTAEKLKRIQTLFDAGKTHAEIAKELGYTKMESYYRYIYRYDANLNYKKLFNKKGLFAVPKQEPQTEVKADKAVEAIPQAKENISKAESILSLISRGIDIREVARKKRFRNVQEMADYMKSKGYIWSSSEKNYVLVPQEKQIQQQVIREKEEPYTMLEDDIRDIMNREDNEHDFGYFERYSTTLKWLENNIEKLQGLLNEQPKQQGEIPRYILPGMTINKGIKINQLLESLIKEFSLEKNIPQKDIIEVALIGFLKGNGYSREVKAVLKL